MSKSKRNKTLFGWILIILALFTFSSTPFRQFASIPEKLRLVQGFLEQLSFAMPVNAKVVTSDPNVVHLNGTQTGMENHDLRKPLTIEPIKPGDTQVTLKVGNIPVKTVNVEVLPEVKLIPGGQSIGVQLQTSGVLVVGHHLIEGQGRKYSPGEQSNIKVGDRIMKVNDVSIRNMEQVGKLVNESGNKGNPVRLEVIRGKEKLQLKINPAYDEKEKTYRLGVYIRDSAAGVGTLTFYDPKTKNYGALGHVISDMDTGKPIVVGSGHVVQSSVTSIEKGQSGSPGEKYAIFKNENVKLGNIEKNTPFGIFGKMDKFPDHSIGMKPIPIALSEQVKTGPAEIYTVVNGQKVEKFKIEIVNVIQQKFPSTKGLIIKITDPRLLDKTGGIVQGMSGSPIIQNGHLVGAVTHVFVNDPTSGYGTYIEWMLKDAGYHLEKEQPRAS